jgi:hypothetical protein
MDLASLAGHDPRRSIVVTTVEADGGAGSGETKDWLALAAAGARAVVIVEDESARALRAADGRAAPWRRMLTYREVSFPRFFARGPLAEHAGQTVTLRSRVTWQERAVRNLIGVLKGAPAASEALVLTAYYDSSSVVPDVAPGAEQAIPPAVLIEFVRALAPYRGQLERDVIFVATAGHAQGLAGAGRLMEAIATFTRQRRDYRPPEAGLADEERLLQFVERGREWLARPERWAGDAAAFRAHWTEEAPDFRAWFEARVKAVAGELNLEHKEAVLARKLEYLRAGSPVFRDGFNPLRAREEERKDPANRHPLLTAFLAAQTDDNRSGALIATPLPALVARPEFAEWRLRDRLAGHLEALAAQHRQAVKEWRDRLAVRDLFAAYRRTLAVNLELSSGGPRGLRDLSLQAGIPAIGTVVEPEVTELAQAATEKTPGGEDGRPAFRVIHWGLKDAQGTEVSINPHLSGRVLMESAVWTLCGRLAFSAVNYEHIPARLGTPEDRFEGLSAAVPAEQAAVLGKTLLAVAKGRVPFKAIPADQRKIILALRGSVYGMAGVGTVVPSHPMAVRTFVRPYEHTVLLPDLTDPTKQRGVTLYPVLAADGYGRFQREFLFNQLDFGGWGGPLTVDAARFDEAGRILFFKNQAPSSQAVFRNEQFPTTAIRANGGQVPRPVSVALFRCAQVSLYEQTNPRSMKPFKRVSYLARQGLGAPRHYRTDTYTAFLEPDMLFYVGLMDGAADNEQVLTYRAFMLNADPTAPVASEEPDLYGEGYLAADTGCLLNPAIDAAGSMLRTAGKRLDLQRRYGMADELMASFHERSAEWLAQARTARDGADPLGAAIAAGKSLSYAINNHPVVRRKIAHAITGILWYLALLVPFVFFMEKLLFGFTDIRRQILAMGAIFLVVFALLRAFHPAFQMVRSSLMILLGFIIFLLTVLVTLMVGGKFRQNIRDLRRREGRVEGADINRGGVIGTAFMLGLNNMRRRKVRTGLTCVTLVLITFVMICFTSISSDLVNVEYPVGRSPWNGIFVRNENYLPIDAAAANTLRQLYGLQFPVTAHAWLTGVLNADQLDRLRNAEIVVDREFTVGGQKVQKRAQVNAAVQFEWNEPMFSGLDRHLLTHRGWFPRGPATRAERQEAMARGYQEQRAVILPDAVARPLGITVEDVDAGGVRVSIRGDEYEVLGILDTAALTDATGVDGRSLLPYDLNNVQGAGVNTERLVVIPEDVKRLSGSQVILANRFPTLKSGYEQTTLVSCGILFPRDPYRLVPGGPERPAVGFKEQRRLVLDHLERLGEKAYYAVDGVAYHGSRTRARTFEGFLELLIPILIAALTVFNTMRGSVYERREEIYVYNAVGIAPNHVFFMFMAEASVYAVVGALLGYLLSQTTGRVLTALGLTGGMNMNYSSIETIYASLAIMGAVLFSTLLPARDAARLASPSETRGWSLPEAEGDVMTFHLPFTFTGHDRVAVISYFVRWLDANGEGSAGPFFCGPPEPRLRREPGEPSHGGLVPGVASTVWLRPYDLGVSQRLEISLPTDPETGEYVATVRLRRLSGTMVAWQRTVQPFLRVLRKQFLNWRATTLKERAEMYTEARDALRGCALEEAVHA